MNAIVITLALISCTLAVVYGYGYHEEAHGPAHYKFGYAVHDAHTGDVKEQHEERDGDVVKGSYSFAEADGTKRIVEYIADHHGGFNAVVKRVGHAHHPQHYYHQGEHGEAEDNHGGAHSSVGTTHFGYHH